MSHESLDEPRIWLVFAYVFSSARAAFVLAYLHCIFACRLLVSGGFCLLLPSSLAIRRGWRFGNSRGWKFDFLSSPLVAFG